MNALPLLVLLTGCTPYAPLEHLFTVQIAADDTGTTLRADAGESVPVTVTVELDATDFYARSDWPSLALTLSGGTWVDDTDGIYTLDDLAQKTVKQFFHPDPAASTVSVNATLSVEGTEYPESDTARMCPALVAEPITLTSASMTAENGSVTALTATVRSVSGELPSPGTTVSFTVEKVGGLTAVFDHETVLVDPTTGQATANVLLDAPKLTNWVTVEVTATAQAPTWESCAADAPVTGSVTLQLLPPEQDSGDTGDTGGTDTGG